LDSNFVEYSLDSNGDLYLKYYFADNSETVNESAVGKFSVGDKALEAADNEAIGLPFSILPNRDLSIKKDFHPWSPKPNATWDDHVEFAKHYAPGHIVALTKDSNLVSAAMSDIKAHNGRLAVVKITDQRARDAYLKDPSLIPRQVSPGFMNLETPNLNGIQKVKWAHLAGVPKGAYGDKATLYASCIGGDECINHLVAASVAQLDEQVSKTYCPVGASENLNTSLGSFSTNQNSMSVNANTTESTTTAPPTPTTPVVSTTPPQKGAPITTGNKGIVKLKNPQTQVPAVTNNSNQQIQGQEPTDDVAKLKQEVEAMKQIQQQAERKEQIKRLIPKELFINKGKFDEKAFDAEVEKRLQSGASDEQLNEFYTLWMDKQKLINAGYQIQQEQPQMQMEIPTMTAPTGGSSNYQTSTEVPTGGSAVENSVNSQIQQLLLRIIVRDE
jgi:hypothetical protein